MGTSKICLLKHAQVFGSLRTIGHHCLDLRTAWVLKLCYPSAGTNIASAMKVFSNWISLGMGFWRKDGRREFCYERSFQARPRAGLRIHFDGTGGIGARLHLESKPEI